MFEARLPSSGVLKKVLDAIKDLLNEATFDCNDSGIQVSTLCSFFHVNFIIKSFYSYKRWTTPTSPWFPSLSDAMVSINIVVTGTCRWE